MCFKIKIRSLLYYFGIYKNYLRYPETGRFDTKSFRYELKQWNYTKNFDHFKCEKEGEDYVDGEEGDNGVDDEHADEENNEYEDDEDRLVDEEYAIDDEEDGDVPKQLSNVSEDDDDDSSEETAITKKTLELANADRKGT